MLGIGMEPSSGLGSGARRTTPLFLLAFVSLYTCAQTYRTRIYNELDGLPSSMVYGIAEGRDGRLWFATRTGLAAYDGRSWQITSQIPGVPSAALNEVCVDETGRVWAITLQPPAYLVHRGPEEETWTVIRGPRQMKPTLFTRMEVVTWSGKPVAVIRTEREGLNLYSEGNWSHLTEETGLIDAKIRGLTQAGQKIYLASASGISVLTEHGVSDEINARIPPDRRNLCAVHEEIHADGTRRLWLMGTGWFGTLEDDGFALVGELPKQLDVTQHLSSRMLPDGGGGLFLGYERQLWHHDGPGGALTQLTPENGMSSTSMSDLLRDWEGNFWVTCYRGVTKIPSLRFENWDTTTGLFDNEVTAILEIAPGKMLLGHNHGLTLLVKGVRRTIPLPDPIGSNAFTRVMDLTMAPDGTIWIALNHGGIASLGKDNRIAYHPAMEDTRVYTILAEPNGTIWAGGHFGLATKTGDRFTVLDDPASRTPIRRLYRSRDGTLYGAGFREGILKRDQRSQILPTDNPEANFYAVLEDSRDRLWAGAGDGLYRHTAGTFTRVTSASLTNDRPIYFLTEDPDGGIWMGQDNGIRYWNGTEERYYSPEQGLAGLETNRAAGIIDHQGKLWVGTDLGLSIYHRRYDQDPNPPRITISTIEANGERMTQDGEIGLAHDQNDLVITLSVLSFINEDKTRFQYRLVGRDATWTEAREPIVRYTGLPPGPYELEARALNALGTPGEIVVSPTITIAQPFWQLWWFRAIAVLVGLMIIAAIGTYVSARRYSRHLETEVAHRTERIQSLNRNLAELNEALEQRVEDRTAQLEAAHKELVENAHYAGMAEIATSILHNVGNILNSVTTSGYCLRDRLSQSRLESLERANDLLEQRRSELTEALADDHKGLLLLDFYPKLTALMRDEQCDALSQVDTLLEKIDTIKEVVAQHHNYASGIYQSERLELESLVDIALGIMGLTNGTDEIHVNTDFEPAPPVMVQKTKMIHILVNLIKNAKESIRESGESGTIQIRIQQTDEDVVLAIEDDGIGIRPADLTRIFCHGYTTKEGGNGFGLHSVATSIQEMNGEIRVASEGLGHGATFALVLPIPAAIEERIAAE